MSILPAIRRQIEAQNRTLGGRHRPSAGGWLLAGGMALAGFITTAIVRQPAAGKSNSPIDHHALVSRHNIVRTQLDFSSPLQVGNGEFAFGADITGLQTFTPFASMSDWGWHSFPLTRAASIKGPRGKREFQ